MNLYALLSSPDDVWERWAALAVAETRGKARWMAYRETSDGCAIYETQYVVRLAAKNIDAEKPCIILTADERPDLWAIAKERTGIYQRDDE